MYGGNGPRWFARCENGLRKNFEIQRKNILDDQQAILRN